MYYEWRPYVSVTERRRKAAGEKFHHIVNVGVRDLAKAHTRECLWGIEH